MNSIIKKISRFCRNFGEKIIVPREKILKGSTSNESLLSDAVQVTSTKEKILEGSKVRR